MLDFAAIKAEMGIGDRPILETLREMDVSRRSACEAILLRHEEHAARHSTLNPGCHELLEWVAERKLPRALVTRNSRSSMRTVIAKHGLSFDALVSRDDGPAKPDPVALFMACERLAHSPGDAWMIGDGHHDIEAGCAAGMRTIWISHGGPRAFAAQPWREVRDLIELRQVLAESY